ncbi:MAG: hypothetical protein GXO10_00250, partial [Crenarchaeota archaeon]|nr:hypothetical protein [Thermoproteota archaeon]
MKNIRYCMLTLVVAILLMLTCAVVHAQYIGIAPRKTLYVIRIFTTSYICAYVKYSGPTTILDVELDLYGLTNNMIFTFTTSTEISSPGKVVCVPVEVPISGLYVALMKAETESETAYASRIIARVIAVNSTRDVIVGDNIVVFAIDEPIYGLRTLYYIAKYAYDRYAHFGLTPARPCYIGRRLVITTAALPSGILGITYFLSSRSCVLFIVINSYIEDLNVLKHTVAHEMFHSIQTRYYNPLYFTSREEYLRHLWLIEGGADAAPYFVWGKDVERDIIGYLYAPFWFISSEYLRYSPTYRYDPSNLLNRVYDNCIGNGGQPSTCFEDAYLYSYTYSPVVLYILHSLGLNPETMNILYSSYYPQSDSRVLKALHDAYLTYVNGYVFIDSALKPQMYSISNDSTFFVCTRAVRYLVLNGLSEGEYRFTYHCNTTCSIDIYMMNSANGNMIPLKNNTRIHVSPRTYFIVIGNVPKNMITINEEYSACYQVKFIFRSAIHVVPHYFTISPSNVTITQGSNTTLNIYVRPCSDIKKVMLMMEVKNSSVSSIVHVERGNNNENIYCIIVNNGTVETAVCNITLLAPCTSTSCDIARLVMRGNNPGTTTITVYGAALLRNGEIVKIEPASSEITVKRRIVVPPGQCVLLLNSTDNFATVNSTITISATLLNCPYAAGLLVSLRYNGSLVSFEKLISGPFVKIVKGILVYHNTVGLLNITVAGERPCNSTNIRVFSIVFKAIANGVLVVGGYGQVSDVHGRIYNLKVIPVKITISKVLECDFNRNGRLDIGDVVLLLRILVGEFHSNVP